MTGTIRPTLQRALFLLSLAAVWPALTQAQQTLTPATPCAKPTTLPVVRSWKNGEAEQKEFSQASSAKEAKERDTMLGTFLLRYPDSDYRDLALVTKLGTEDQLENWTELATTARQLLRSSSAATAPMLVGAYVYLADALFHTKADDAVAVANKINDVTWAVRCGRETLAQLNKSANSAEVDAVRSVAEFTFATAQAQVSLMAKDYPTGKREATAARGLKPGDARPNYLLGIANLTGNPPDYDAAIFYLARACTLSCDDSLKKSLAELYKAYHGSDKGLDKVLALAKTNQTPPDGFHVEQPTKKNHAVVTTAAAVVIAALLGYAIIKSPETFAAIGQALGTPRQRKVMIFGGANHTTYLGCLSCTQFASDSVLNEFGEHGSSLSSQSIWNNLSPFGSPLSAFSACNPYASDPPVIVDEGGDYLGRLTLNTSHRQIGKGIQLYNWLETVVCKSD